MENGSRKATDVLLELEAKINSILGFVKMQDQNMKILSNKLNTILEAQRQLLQQKVISQPKIEVSNSTPIPTTNNSERQIIINPENTIPVQQSPQGFRRTSRQEGITEPKPVAKAPPAEILMPKQEIVPQEQTKEIQNLIPVIQRVVDRNSKSIFLAEVEILDASNNNKVSKTRTNGTGKWTASLPAGKYCVLITRRDTMTKEEVKISQDIIVDGKSSPLSLPLLIFK